MSLSYPLWNLKNFLGQISYPQIVGFHQISYPRILAFGHLMYRSVLPYGIGRRTLSMRECCFYPYQPSWMLQWWLNHRHLGTLISSLLQTPKGSYQYSYLRQNSTSNIQVDNLLGVRRLVRDQLRIAPLMDPLAGHSMCCRLDVWWFHQVLVIRIDRRTHLCWVYHPYLYLQYPRLHQSIID